ncbi:PVC-type heme-binding CxxCH protein [Alienimonas californiensis]|uniref:Cytochrome c n=1 Tax=Alienimonas californiensis TaxID=2527989 RepID=A0A517P7A1_9PLAN|nr:PVC-type heme-binding CxxCH protein [Alienimonas californiensis]QDT15244.1 Cytochrome c [Alienimonas californiensis]
MPPVPAAVLVALTGVLFAPPLLAAEPVELEHDADLEVALLLADPTIAQPIEVKQDERGRLWVVEYRQYPDPAGLTELERDEYWRVRWDRELPPPPYEEGSPFRGRDRISVHSDADGDGTYETHQTFLEGLNLTTSVAFDAGRGGGGVWVLSPPQLLFYPDADGDLVPDGPPEVHLTGFGLEDTHSIANSLTWGPDGWLYGGNGSTCTIAVTAPLATPDAPPVKRSGQLVWRYRPDVGFEVFAEGGGNTFGLEIDAAGHVFSGHNGGDTRGFHFVDGGYYRKNFGKHGDLSNPLALGFFEAIPHPPVARFTHHFVRYDADALPQRFHGNLVALDVLHNDLALTAMRPNGSTFATEDLSRPVRGGEDFRPVDLELAFDGTLLMADWADAVVSHYRNHEGEIEPSTGRIYRVQPKGWTPAPPPDFSNGQLVERLKSPNRAVRRTAVRLIRQRGATELLDDLEPLMHGPAPIAFDAYAAARSVADVNQRRKLDRLALNHNDASVRRLAIATTDLFEPPSGRHSPLANGLVWSGADASVLVALAGRSRRLAPVPARSLVGELSRRRGLADDPYFPLALWWAVERQLSTGDAEAVLAALDRENPLFDEVLAPRILRWAVAQDSSFGRSVVAELLQNAEDAGPLFDALNEAAAGSAERSFGEAVDRRVREAGEAAPLALRVRLGLVEPAAALAELANTTSNARRDALLGVIEDTGDAAFLPGLLDLAAAPGTPARLRSRLFTTLAGFDSPQVASRLLTARPDLDEAANAAIVELLAARPGWTAALLDAIDAGAVDPAAVSALTVQGLRRHADPALRQRLAERWPETPVDPAETEKAFAFWSRRLAVGGRGDAERGAAVYKKHCANCHTLHGVGQLVGPDLTAYQRTKRDQTLLAIVAPSAEIREGFETALLLLEDGSTLTGLLVRQTDETLELKDARGHVRTLRRADVAALEITGTSLMPNRLLDQMTDREARDLFRYLESEPPAPAEPTR